ncbi:hypothetical protein HPP92_027356 [Vanilla planifolia]|uniref:Uncharacterized protein n=1 Tax=Vanilla planifolia TaxID=51239 RepID=A0A835PCY4_VANPL|nr:hypothetical protein HPP92_027356 [Vanilla planifolia]
MDIDKVVQTGRRSHSNSIRETHIQASRVVYISNIAKMNISLLDDGEVELDKEEVISTSSRREALCALSVAMCTLPIAVQVNWESIWLRAQDGYHVSNSFSITPMMQRMGYSVMEALGQGQPSM